MFRKFYQLVQRCYKLARPYGLGRLSLVLAVILLNGLFQVIGVTSVFPFFALAADPEMVKNSAAGVWVLERLPPMEDRDLLIWAGLFSIALLFVANGVSLMSDVIRSRYGHGFGHMLRSNIIESLSRRPYGYFLENNSGAMLQKIGGDVNQFIGSVFLPILDALARLVTLSLLLLAVFLVDPMIALGAGVVIGGIYTVVLFVLRKRSHAIGLGLQVANRGAMIAAKQFISGIKPILVHQKAEYFKGAYCRHSKQQARLHPWIPIFAHGPRYLIEPLAFGALVAVIIVFAASGRPFIELLPSLSVMAFAGYRMLPAVQLFYSQLTMINTMRYTVDEIEGELMAFDAFAEKGKPRVESSSATESPGIDFNEAIQLKNISFEYPGAKAPVLENFNLTIPKNSAVGVVGPTGSGKSTLVDIILGLHKPTSGEILVDGRKLEEADLPAFRRMIGYVPQDIYLMDSPIAENIAFGVAPGEIDQEALHEAARAAQILNFIETELPKGWGTVVGERGVRLSGGQRQRVGLARALYHKPEFLILDEATSALDVNTETEVMKAIRSLQGTITMIIIAHRLSTIETCSEVCKLEGGKAGAKLTS